MPKSTTENNFDRTLKGAVKVTLYGGRRSTVNSLSCTLCCTSYSSTLKTEFFSITLFLMSDFMYVRLKGVPNCTNQPKMWM